MRGNRERRLEAAGKAPNRKPFKVHLLDEFQPLPDDYEHPS